jgi:deazaflavin-dependent oxidoreductase (nitroreductase family)
MTTPVPDPVSDFNANVIEEFRANQGNVGGLLAGTPMILIHHIGARSGAERVTPLACNPQPDGRIAIVASNQGSPANPAWYYNLKAHPRITVEVGTQTFTALAQELDDAARASLWASLVAQSPDIGKHQATTTRQIPVFLLTRQDLASRDRTR